MKIQNRICIITLKEFPFSSDLFIKGKIIRINILKTKSRTPPNLFGMVLNIV